MCRGGRLSGRTRLRNNCSFGRGKAETKRNRRIEGGLEIRKGLHRDEMTGVQGSLDFFGGGAGSFFELW